MATNKFSTIESYQEYMEGQYQRDNMASNNEFPSLEDGSIGTVNKKTEFLESKEVVSNDEIFLRSGIYSI